ncbi:hypothetical protein [Nocardia rosealba]|uniref:hypothetical protein n=1 Tax=Nocardia rosealba TaxID=2878563 RepID=UPI001CD9E732|nr:hypothetical protein [Nocardia rosealba]MCA2209528.1 hypothetical protein [Nocardia rosealba]
MYVYTNLSAALRDKTSPLREYLHSRYPNTRAVQGAYRRAAGPLLVDTGGANPATLGAAFDFEVRFLLVPDHEPVLPLLGFFGFPQESAVIESVIETAQAAVASTAEDVDRLGRACWALALCTDVYRRGLLRESALDNLLRTGRFTPDHLLALAPPDAIRQLWELRGLAEEHLFPHLGSPTYPGPTFDASVLCNADADLISAHTLLDLKTHLGPKNQRTGIRSDALTSNDLYQIITYALFDHSDAYHLTEVGIYSARYAHLETWPLTHLLAILAGTDIDLTEERETVWRLLGGPLRS